MSRPTAEKQHAEQVPGPVADGLCARRPQFVLRKLRIQGFGPKRDTIGGPAPRQMTW